MYFKIRHDKADIRIKIQDYSPNTEMLIHY